jgi:hypothetical protein
LGWGIFYGTRKYYLCERFAICSHYFIILRGRCRFGFGFALTDTDSFEKAASQYRKVVRVRWAKFVPLFESKKATLSLLAIQLLNFQYLISRKLLYHN